MINPHQLRSQQTSSSDPNSSRPTRVVLDRISDHSKSRWDQPITVPQLLFMKFKIPPPPSSTQKQSKQYPLSLIDYIRRAYDRCQDQAQTKVMEHQLKNIIAKHQDNYHAVTWETLPLPLLPEHKKISIDAQPSHLRDTKIKKQAVNLHKQYSTNNLNRREEGPPPQLNVKVASSLQKLQERLNQNKTVEEPRRTFTTGFTDAPLLNQSTSTLPSYISPHLRTIMNPLPPPPPPKTETTSLRSHDKKDGYMMSEEKSLKAKDKRDHQEIKVIHSTDPEPVDLRKLKTNQRQKGREKDSRETFTQKGKDNKQKILISRQKLTQISKVAGKVSDLHQVAKRFESFNRLKYEPSRAPQEEDDYEENDEIIVGKSTSIDKPYLRITGRPDPETVRPLHILKKSLTHFSNQYRKGNVAYDMLISQLRSIRQDVTVQHIRDPFAVEVYEENFKFSLFENDIIQVKHCQANLWELYREGICRDKDERSRFIGYNFTTLILEQKYKDLEYMLTLLPPGTLQHPAIQDSLRLKQILLLGNYRAFFDFYNDLDQITRQLLNFYIDKIRMKCLVMFSKTCGERMSLSVLGQMAGEDEDVLEALAVGEGAAVRDGFFMLKESYEKLSQSDFLMTKKVTNLLI